MTSEGRDLQAWYREAMLRRIDELVALRPGLQAGDSDAADELRQVAQALRGSGGTFGFPELSTVAGAVELTSDGDALRRMEGLLAELRRFVGRLRDERARIFEWMAVAVGVSPDEAAELLADAEGVEVAWQRLRGHRRVDDAAMAGWIAEHFGLEVADPGARSRAAQRLLPEAFMASWGCVPLREDPVSITLATDHPVSLSLEVEARRLTGRQPVFAVAPPAVIGASLASLLDEATRGRIGRPETRREAPEPADRGSATAKRPPSVGEGPPTVLVVDDEASARVLVRSLLEKRGYTAVEASDGVEALHILQEEGGVGLAVVDLKMPRMDGLELIWELRDEAGWAELPVIVVTGEQDRMLETWIMEEGADDYVRKPIDPRLFLARVESTLRRTEARSAPEVPRVS